MRVAGSLAALVLASLAFASPAAAQWTGTPADEPIAIIDREDACLETVPAVRPSTARSPVIDLRVAVLLDGITEAQARPALDFARKAYAEVGVNFIPMVYAVTGLQKLYTGDLIDEARTVFGGKRPGWAHVVAVLTKKDLVKRDGDNTVAGHADCIGGVRTPETAFAVVEGLDKFPPEEWGGITLAAAGPGEVTAHEVGHVMGAHHHYATCPEGYDPDEPTRLTMCSMMFPDTFFIGTRFGTLEASVIRAYAEAYVKPVTEAPPPAGTTFSMPGTAPAPAAQVQEQARPKDETRRNPPPQPRPQAAAAPAPAATSAPMGAPPAPPRSRVPRATLRGSRLSVSCPAGCRVVVSASAGGRALRLRRRVLTVPAGTTRALRLAPARRDRRRAGLPARVTIRVSGPDGSETLRRTVVLR